VQPTAESDPAAKQPDVVAIACIVLIAVGWFLLSTLVFTVGRVAQPTHFYQMLAVLNHPGMLLVGVSSAAGFEVVLFSLLCLGVLVAALMPHFSARGAWWSGWLPLLLMLVCLIALYSGGTPERAAQAAAGGDSLGGQLMRLAHAAMQDAMQSAQLQAANHVRPGAGGVLSILASVALAVRCTSRRPRARAAVRQPL
jgi:hypothetical protein